MCVSMLVTQFGCTGTLCMSSYSRCASRCADSVTVFPRLLTSPPLCVPFFPCNTVEPETSEEEGTTLPISPDTRIMAWSLSLLYLADAISFITFLCFPYTSSYSPIFIFVFLSHLLYLSYLYFSYVFYNISVFFVLMVIS